MTEKGRQRLEREAPTLQALLERTPGQDVAKPSPQERQEQQRIHVQIQDQLEELGTILGKYAKKEYRHQFYAYDVVWKESEYLPRASHCFEVQHHGNLVEALAKLKHAHDIWNSRLSWLLLASKTVPGPSSS